MLRKIKSYLAVLLMLALAFTLLIPAPVQAASKKKPAKVTVTSVKTSGTNKVVVKWKKAKYATNYRIYWKQAGTKKWRTLATVKSNRTSYTHKSNSKARLVAGKKYVYTVRAYNRYGRKWGSYNTKGKTVTIPKKKATTPTKTPVKPKPTAPAKPTQPAKPTAVPTQKPKPTEVPVEPTQTPAKPTATPVPVKPTEAPKPTATPAPAKPTATPAPVKVSNVTVNPATVKLTSKGQTTQLSATVLPSNAENKSIIWSTSNASVATVDNNGVVSAVANGNATITAAALDGSGKYAECSVVVEIPKENNQVVELAGGAHKELGPTKSLFPEITDFSQVTFDIQDPNHIIEVSGFSSNKRSASVGFTGLRIGSATIIAKYGNKTLQRHTINVTSNWDEYIGYVNWRKQIESQIWTSSMSLKEKMDAAKDYIQSHFVHKDGSDAAVSAYKGNLADCITASEFMGDFAKDVNAKVQYGSTYTGKFYDYITSASSDGGHTFTRILINNEWVIYDANPPHV